MKNQVNAKHHTYATQIIIAKKQFVDKKRFSLPQFLAALTSSMGKFCVEMVKL